MSSIAVVKVKGTYPLKVVEECLCEESENGICNDCGEEVDWISRTFKEIERD